MVVVSRVSNVHRLRHTDCIFCVTVNRRAPFKPFNEMEYGLLLRVLEESRARLEQKGCQQRVSGRCEEIDFGRVIQRLFHPLLHAGLSRRTS